MRAFFTMNFYVSSLRERAGARQFLLGEVIHD